MADVMLENSKAGYVLTSGPSGPTLRAYEEHCHHSTEVGAPAGVFFLPNIQLMVQNLADLQETEVFCLLFLCNACCERVQDTSGQATSQSQKDGGRGLVRLSGPCTGGTLYRRDTTLL